MRKKALWFPTGIAFNDVITSSSFCEQHEKMFDFLLCNEANQKLVQIYPNEDEAIQNPTLMVLRSWLLDQNLLVWEDQPFTNVKKHSIPLLLKEQSRSQQVTDALNYALDMGWVEMFAFLLKKGAKPNAYSSCLLKKSSLDFYAYLMNLLPYKENEVWFDVTLKDMLKSLKITKENMVKLKMLSEHCQTNLSFSFCEYIAQNANLTKGASKALKFKNFHSGLSHILGLTGLNHDECQYVVNLMINVENVNEKNLNECAVLNLKRNRHQLESFIESVFLKKESANTELKLKKKRL